jgi:tetratricopeptide (TPR) repeat protein
MTTQEKAIIIQLLTSQKYNEAANHARALAEENTDDFEFPLLQGVALMHMKKYDKAAKILERAVARFPTAWELHSVLGDARGHLGNFDQAEDEYRKAMAAIPEANRSERADQHCRIAEMMWAQHRRDDALGEWRKALDIHPGCKEAKRSLKEHTNEYGEARGPSAAFDDLYHFTSIHRKRYFAVVGKNEFETVEEAERVQTALMDAWNKHITPHARRLDTMTTAEKTALFESVVVDFGC